MDARKRERRGRRRKKRRRGIGKGKTMGCVIYRGSDLISKRSCRQRVVSYAEEERRRILMKIAPFRAETGCWWMLAAPRHVSFSFRTNPLRIDLWWIFFFIAWNIENWNFEDFQIFFSDKSESSYSDDNLKIINSLWTVLLYGKEMINLIRSQRAFHTGRWGYFERVSRFLGR